jgi:hypothetical protein
METFFVGALAMNGSLSVGRRSAVLLVGFGLVLGCGSVSSVSPDGGHDAKGGSSGGATGAAGDGGGGATGAAGATGSAGTTGGAGTTGSAGSVATAGTTGSAGTIGGAGTTGGGGTTGSAGRGGATGNAGTTGTAGRGGTTGNAGTTGTAGRGGTTGNAGTTGAAGRGGTTGNAGTTGAAGVAGTTGAAGIIGSTGMAGMGGSTGMAGTGGTGMGVCTPGARQCANNTTPQTCSAQGQWVSNPACMYVCTGMGVCGGQCVPGSMRCQGGINQMCDSTGFWQNVGTSTLQLLRNPNFDTTPVYWTDSSGLGTGYSIISLPPQGFAAQSGPLLAWEGGYDSAADDLYQTITIPAGATSIVFSFYYYIATQETGTVGYDVMDAYIYDNVTQTPTVVIELSNVNATSAWTLFSKQLPLSLAGGTWDFGFAAITDETVNTNFFIDTVALSVAACPSAGGTTGN